MDVSFTESNKEWDSTKSSTVVNIYLVQIWDYMSKLIKIPKNFPRVKYLESGDSVKITRTNL